MIFVFFRFKESLFAENHSSAWIRFETIFDFRSSLLLPEQTSVVSSAKMDVSAFMLLEKSLIYIMNRRGPNMEP